ncbi:hypothetical protein [Leifsonia sp. Leaf264]|uniref:hypothetical protein n=1 Tax=Leifsonia sp. Leaf264 TaxID=1736314 RepID=UPI000A86B121|nr:hypothetical protein [Leifsonia sp. Leaf264]
MHLVTITHSPSPTPTAGSSTWAGLTFDTLGNGAEVLWAGAFTLIGILASVGIALAIQRADFAKRSTELQTTANIQREADLTAWRRSIAERAIGIITRVSVEVPKPHPTPWWILRNEIDDVHTLLHLDPEEGGHIMGEWLIAQCTELWKMRPISQANINDLMEAASKARAKVMIWALHPDAPTDDEEVTHLAATAFPTGEK